jgi:predicted nucleotidyltransferase
MGAVGGWIESIKPDHPELLALGVFGSYARGDAGVGSDLDLVAIVRSSAAPFVERGRAWPVERLPVPAEILVYTSDEWADLERRGGRFPETLRRETRWIFSA